MVMEYYKEKKKYEEYMEIERGMKEKKVRI